MFSHVQMLFTATASVVIHNFWDVEDQNTQLLEMIMFFKVRPPSLLCASKYDGDVPTTHGGPY